jgi:hypothetical protein
MVAQLWPASLPKPLVDGFSAQEENNLSAFKPELGQALVWPRSPDAGDFVSWQFLMTKAQVVIFRDYYRTTLNFGVNHIIMRFHLTDEDDQEFQVDPTTVPGYVPVSTDLFRVTLQVYRIPANAMSGM